MLSHQIELIRTAVTYYSRLPWPGGPPRHSENLNTASRYLTLVGVIVGTLAGLSFWLIEPLVGKALASVVGLTIGVLVTGAFHEDGFADTCDGFGGGWKPQQILDIMKDSRTGAFGVVGVSLLMLGKYTALSTVMSERLVWIFIASHALSRSVPLALIAILPYVRLDETSKAKPIAKGLTYQDLSIGLIIALLAGILGFGEQLWVPLILLGVLVLLAKIYFRNKLGGYTGDCLGAAQQLGELLCFAAAAALFAA